MVRSTPTIAIGMVLSMLTAASLLGGDGKKSRPGEARPALKRQDGKKPPSLRPCLQAGEAAIEKALASETQIEVTEMPLWDVLDFLRNHHKIEIALDIRALSDVGIGSDTIVTFRVRGVPFRSALNLMLRPLNLTWTIHNDVLLITTPEEAESLLYPKVLDVGDLVVCRDKDGKLWDDYDSLIIAINRVVKPTTWDQVGGPGGIAPANFGTAKALVINQTYQVHCQIAELLAEIRAIAKKTPNAEPPQRDRPAQKTPPRVAGGMF
jgi:hypothetical protein